MAAEHRKPLIRGWDDGLTAEEYLNLDDLTDVACCTAEAISTFLHVEEDERARIAGGACEWLAVEIDRAGGLLDADEFMRRCRCRMKVAA